MVKEKVYTQWGATVRTVISCYVDCNKNSNTYQQPA